jgi:DNA polymerase III subunit gamma/tau
MEYKALYREYRPGTFDEVVGQKHVVEALRNSVKNNRIAHAYLFCGTRGTGKTSIAKIFARAVNCLDQKNGNPCNECAICRGILSERILDVIEIDAASNNSVDNVRDIRDEVVYMPSEAKHKVYIIDEVHMLSGGAFNALLKTLEEPPSHVMFILATTEPQKLPATILSRCQRYDFKRISLEDIYMRIVSICADLDIEAEEKALRLISKAADGALRDALSILDKCISVIDGKLRFDDVFKIIGISDTALTKNIVQAVLTASIEGVIEHIDKVEKSGVDLKYFVSELIEYLRNMLVCTLTSDPTELVIADDDVLSEIKQLAKAAGRSRVLSMLEKLSSLNREIRWVPKPRVFIEIALIELALQNEGVSEPINEEAPKVLIPGSLWERTINGLMDTGKVSLAAYLAGTTLECSDNIYTIVFPSVDAVKKKTVEKNENLEQIKTVLSKLLKKKDLMLRCKLDDEAAEEKKQDFSGNELETLFDGVTIKYN